MRILQISDLKKEAARLRSTLGWSIEGLQACWRDEKSIRQWAGLNVVGWIGLAFSGCSPLEAVVLFALGGLVIVVELLNSALEAAVDFVSVEQHPLAKKAKDIASAAVMTTALIWVSCWVIIVVN